MKIQEKQNFKKKRKTLIVKKAFNQIKFNQQVAYENKRAFKGNRKDTNLLNINFKTRICKVLQQMRLTKQMNAQEVKTMNDFKESPPSFQNLVQLIYGSKKSIQKNKSIKKLSDKSNKQKRMKKSENQMVVKSPNIFLRLKRLFQSSQIVKRIYENEGSLVNKLLMLKYIEAIRYTVIGKGQIIKWKQLRLVPTPL